MGKALWFCQCFEELLAYHLCLLYDIPKGTAEDIASKMLDEKRSKTLGRLVREVTEKKSLAIPPTLETRLKKFTDERNWLAHRVQAENHTDLYHRHSFLLLLERLDALKEEAKHLSKVFELMLDEWAETQGLSQTELTQLMEKTIKEWRTA